MIPQINVGKKGQKLENGDTTVNASVAILDCRNRFLSTPVDKAAENNQKKVVALLKAWPARHKRRTEITDALRKISEEHSKDIASLKDTSGLRALVREAERLGRPRVKPEILQDARALLLRLD